jgi:hypothetical protein
MLDLLVDALPTYEGLRIFYILTHVQSPSAVLNAIQRRLCRHMYYGDDVEVPFEVQAEQIIRPFFLRISTMSDAEQAALQQNVGNMAVDETFGATRHLPFEHVTKYLRASAKRGENIDPVHMFLTLQFRPDSFPAPRLRFKQGQSVWMSIAPNDWIRAIVLKTNASSGPGRHVAAYVVKIFPESNDKWMCARAHGNTLPIAMDCDRFIRKKRPPLPPPPGSAPEDARAAAERREAHNRREAMERARELENERQRKARAKEERRRRQEEEERRRLSSVHAAQARAAVREPAPWPADMPLRGEGSDAPARARRETEKTEALARVSEHRARLREQEEERANETLRQMELLELLRIGDSIQRGDGE